MLSDPVSISKFGIKLMAFYFTNSSMTQIAVRCVHDLPPPLRRLFRNEEGTLSLLPITKLLPRVTVVSLTELQLADLTENGEQYMMSITEFAENSRNANVQTIEFRSVFMEQMREDSTLTALISKYGNGIAPEWTLRYEFSNNPYHRIVAQRLSAKLPTETDSDPKWSWTPKTILPDCAEKSGDGHVKHCTLSLDADPIVLSEYSDDEKMEFGMNALRTIIGDDVMDRFKLKLFIERFEEEIQGNIDIWYRVIVMEEEHSGVVMKIIEQSSCEVGHLEINGMMLPVKSNKERYELSLSKRTMLEEYRAREESEKLKYFQAETERLKTEWNDIERQRVAAELAAKSERDRLDTERQILQNEMVSLEREREAFNAEAENLRKEKTQYAECVEKLKFTERNLDIQAMQLKEERKMMVEESIRIESEQKRLEVASIQIVKSKIQCLLQNGDVDWDKDEEEIIEAFRVHVSGRYDS